MDGHGNPGRTQRLAYLGSGMELFLIFLVNTLLKIVTLGIYHFWAKARVRRYLWTHTEFDGERLEYTGTGGELFLGFLRALAIMIVMLLALFVLWQISEMLAILVVMLAYLMSPALVGALLYLAQRYRFSRTRFRGIRFGLQGKAIEYGFKFFGYGLLVGLTLGIYKPHMSMQLSSYTLNNTWFGSQQAGFTGQGGDLMGRFMLAYGITVAGIIASVMLIFSGLEPVLWGAMIGAVVIAVMLAWYWYSVEEMRYTVSHISLGDMRFALQASHGQMFVLSATNLLLIVITLGLAYAWVTVRTMRFMASHMQVSGELDYAAILQTQEQSDALGEGMAELADIGAL